MVVSTVDKALRIVLLLENRDQMGITAMAKSLRIAPSTVHRLVASLAAHDFIAQDPESRKYRLGMAVFRIGSSVAARFGVRSAALRTMEVLAEESAETVNLGVLVRRQLYYVEKIQTNDPIRVDLQVGHAVPAHCTAMGKVILAYLPTHTREALFRTAALERRTPRSIGDRATLNRELEKIRQRGYARDDSELIEGISCIAAPILSAAGIAIAAISVAGPSSRMSSSRVKRLIPLVMKAARTTSTEIRGLGMTSFRP